MGEAGYSAYIELPIMKSLKHISKTGVGTDGDWKSVMQQFLRCGLALLLRCCGEHPLHCYRWTFRCRKSSDLKVNIGALKKGYVNIAVHGHLSDTGQAKSLKTGQEEHLWKL